MKTKLKNAHIYRRIISLILTVVLLFLAIPQTIFAEIQSAVEESDTQAPASGAANSVKDSYSYNVSGDVYELEERREASVKHFRTEDGSIVAAQYPTDVHILDGNGKWQDIDNTLSDFGSEYGTGNTGIKFAKKITGNESLFTIHDGNGKLTMSLDGAIKKTAGKIVSSTAEDGDGTKLGKLMNLENLSSRIIYENIQNGVDLEYIVNGRNVKENIIVKEKLDSYSFTFTLKLNNLEASLLSDGSVRIFDGDGETVFSIPAPVTYDAEGNYAPAEATYFTLEQTGNNTYVLTVATDSEWMNAEERVYPITVDPTITTIYSNIFDMYITSEVPSGPFRSNDTIFFDDTHIAYLKINNLPNITSHACITQATISLFFTVMPTLPFEEMIGAYQVVSDWDQDLNWNEAHATISPQGKRSPTVLDYNVMPSELTTDLWFTWEITKAVRSWYDGTANYGIAMKTLSDCEYPYDGRAFFVSSTENENVSQRPFFTITYRTVLGIEDYYTYSSHSAGNAGEGYINIGTGKLSFAVPTIASNDALFGYMPSLVYNQALAGKAYTSANSNLTNSNRAAPYGFKWNFQEAIIKKSYTDYTGVAKNYYLHTDSDGSEHAFYFVETKTVNNAVSYDIYRDEDSLLMELHVYSDKIVLKDTSSTDRVFTLSSTDKWALSYVIDAFGNKLSFVGTNPISIKLTPNEQNEYELLRILLSSTNGAPTAVYNCSTGRAVIFRYSSVPTGSISSTYSSYLRQAYHITVKEEYMSSLENTLLAARSSTVGLTSNEMYSVNAVIEYTYDTIGRLLTAADETAGYKISYSYDSVGKVASVTEYGTSQTEGQSLLYTFGDGFATIRSSGNNDIIGDSDDIETTYTLDSYLRVVSNYSHKTDGMLIYGATAGKYETGENIKNNLKYTYTTGGETVNLLLNGSLVHKDTSTGFFKYWSKNGVATAYGTGATFDLSNTSNTTCSMYQKVNLSRGTYTFSILMDNYKANGAEIALNVTNWNTGAVVASKPAAIDETNVDVDGTLYSVTFNIASQGYYKVSVDITAPDSPLSSASVTVSYAILERGIGTGTENFVNAGGFDNIVWDATSNEILAPVTELWKDESGNGANTIAYGYPQGIVSYIIPDFTENKYISQTVYEVSSPHSLASAYVISGFAKAPYAIENERSHFGLRIDVHYAGYDGIITETYRFPFNPNITSWQYMCDIFEVGSGNNIEKIEVICEYSYQSKICECTSSSNCECGCEGGYCYCNYAYFDNISLSPVPSDLTNYGYYEDGRLASYNNALFTERYVYNEEGNLTIVADSKGNLTEYTYDETGKKLLSEKYSLSPTMLTYNFLTYNIDTGYYEAKENPTHSAVLKSTTEYTYDKYGLVTSIITSASGSAYKIVNSYTYDTVGLDGNFGALLTETDSTGITLRYLYDNRTYDLLANVNTSSGTGTVYTYDTSGKLIGVTPATYSQENGASTIIDAESLTYTYNERNLISEIRTESTAYTFLYDTFGNSSSISIGDTALASYVYSEKNGKLLSMTYGNGVVVSYTYDDLDRLNKIWYNTNNEGYKLAYEYTYNSYGQLHSFEDKVSGTVTVYEYDKNHRMSGIIEYDADELTHTFAEDIMYDSETGAVRLIQQYMSYTVGAEKARLYSSISNSYNDDGTLSETDIDSGAVSGTVSYTYDDFYRLSVKTYAYNTDSDSANEFTNTTTYTYKNYGDNTGIEVDSFTTNVNNNMGITYTYTYDSKGNITKIVGTDGSEYRYVYDDLGQLIREDNTKTGKTYLYTYDNAGNITLKKTYTITAAGVTPTSGYSAYLYQYTDSEWGDKLTRYRGVNLTYDEIGNPLSYYNGTSYNFTWVQGRRLESIVKGTNTYTYTYNSDGIRTSKTSGSYTRNYILNGSQIMGEIGSDGSVLKYLYDAEGSPIGMMYRSSTYAEGVFDVFWYEKNLHGDITSVYDVSGTKLVSYIYDAWGNVTTQYHNDGNLTAVIVNPFTYRGYYRDSETGFYYLNSRYYDPVLGRFISTDAYSYLGAYGDFASYNLYAYCANNPVMYYDPSGHFFLTAIIVGALVGAGIAFGATTYADYKDDGEVFNGSIGIESYVLNTLVGGAIGALAGYSAPYVSGFLSSSFTIGSYALAGGGTVAVTVTGAQLAGAAVATAGVALFASNKRPGDNKKQNQQFKDAMRELKVTDRDKMRRVHDQLKGRNLGYKELIDFIRQVLKL